MSYSFDNTNKDRWSELADQYQSQLDELAALNDDSDYELLSSLDYDEIDDFDELEIL